jgi:uncharacterized protein YndB with AHSA1/START domain
LLAVATIEVSVDIAAPVERVWAAVEDISTHTDWMRDAEAIRFTSTQTRGVGTTFDCDTRVGPFRLTDRMEVTEWRDGALLAIRHTGVVTGEGRFQLVATAPDRTRFVWTETLRFPRRRGGRVAATVAAPVLRRIWKGNLERLRDLVERG